MGFPTPLRPWLLDAGAEKWLGALTDPDGLLSAYTDRKALAELLTRHRNLQEDATDRIWRLLNLQLWGDLYITGRRDRWVTEGSANGSTKGMPGATVLAGP
jgi:asparagine synthase (glutamine-hydrolysing)